MDKERCELGIDNFEKGYCCENLEKEYLGFSQFIQGLFISKNGWIVDTGNFQTVNRQLIYDIYEKVRRHPIIWKLFFKVA